MEEAMSSRRATVYVVDDDPQIRWAISSLSDELGHFSESFASPTDFLKVPYLEEPSCLVLDIRFPGASLTGLELQRTLIRAGTPIPIVFITAHPDVRAAVEVMKLGAVDYLAKPFREQELLDAIRHGIEYDCERLECLMQNRALRNRLNSLTQREHQIMLLMAQGLVAKQMANDLQLSEVTVKVHRARMMKKMELKTLVEVARLVDRIHLIPQKNPFLHLSNVA
jgi:FixJ family two-component response regulator